MGTVSTSLPSDGTTIDASDVNTPINAILSEFNGNIDDNNIKSGANINGSKLLASSIPGSKFDSSTQGGYTVGVLPAVSSVTENGNRSADITFASTVASLLTPGMRIRTSRTVAAPTYMGGAFNGTNHYFTKVTCTSTLSTVTDNFTLMGWANPTAYGASACIAGRSDGTVANAILLYYNSSGQVVCQFTNGGAANTRYATSYQSVPLNKKSWVTASYTSTATTFVIYIDGISVPFSVTTGGTAPTVAGTGGDFSIGRFGANNGGYFTGYISGVGVFNAVLSASTIKSYKNQVLSGSETNCIGAWSLNNTGVNQQAAGTNDLTATNSVGYTSGTSPYCTDANGVAAGTYDWAIVTKVVTTVATVQYPEGCAIPTSGGISTVDYSGVKSPFGMPVDAGRWEITVIIKTNVFQAAVTTGVVYNPGGIYISKPIGKFAYSHDATPNLAGTTDAAKTLDFALSTSNSAFSTGTENQSRHHFYIISDVARITAYKNPFVLDEVAATTYYALFNGAGTGTLSSLGFIGTTAQSILTLTPAGL